MPHGCTGSARFSQSLSARTSEGDSAGALAPVEEAPRPLNAALRDWAGLAVPQVGEAVLLRLADQITISLPA